VNLFGMTPASLNCHLPFDGVISTSYALNHIINIEELTCVFHNVYAALLTNGVFIFDLKLDERYKLSWHNSVLVTGYSRTWIYTLVKRYNEYGVAGLGDSEALLRSADRRNQNQGSKPLIDDVEQAQLWQALQGKDSDGGLWNGRKVADWLTCVTGRQVSRLHRMGNIATNDIQIASASTISHPK